MREEKRRVRNMGEENNGGGERKFKRVKARGGI